MSEQLLHPYQYECGNGHYQASRQPLERCLAARCSRPELKRVGRGSKSDSVSVKAMTKVWIIVEADADPFCGYSVKSVHASQEGAEAAYEKLGGHSLTSDFDLLDFELQP